MEGTVGDGDKPSLKYIAKCYNYLLAEKFKIEERINGKLSCMVQCSEEVVYLSIITKRMLEIDDLRTAIANPKAYSTQKLIIGYPLNLWKETIDLIKTQPVFILIERKTPIPLG